MQRNVFLQDCMVAIEALVYKAAIALSYTVHSNVVAWPTLGKGIICKSLESSIDQFLATITTAIGWNSTASARSSHRSSGRRRPAGEFGIFYANSINHLSL